MRSPRDPGRDHAVDGLLRGGPGAELGEERGAEARVGHVLRVRAADTVGEVHTARSDGG